MVVNGEPDPTITEAIEKFNLKLVFDSRKGVSRARNTALPFCAGDIIALTDDDVEVGPNWMHELAYGFDDPQTACVTGRVIPNGLSFQPIEAYYSDRCVSPWTLDKHTSDWCRLALSPECGLGCNFAFRKRFLIDVNGFPEEFGAGSIFGVADEPELFIAVIERGFRITHRPSAFVTHYFPVVEEERRRRVTQMCAGSSAYHLYLLFIHKTLRRSLLRKLCGSVYKLAGRRLRTPLVGIGRAETVRAYISGVGLFWRYLMERRNSSR